MSFCSSQVEWKSQRISTLKAIFCCLFEMVNNERTKKIRMVNFLNVTYGFMCVCDALSSACLYDYNGKYETVKDSWNIHCAICAMQVRLFPSMLFAILVGVRFASHALTRHSGDDTTQHNTKTKIVISWKHTCPCNAWSGCLLAKWHKTRWRQNSI